MCSRHMFQHVPPTRLVVGAQEQDSLCTGSTPEEAWPFQAEIDDAPHCTFNRSAPNRQLQGHQLRIRHPALVLDEVLTMPADHLAVAPPAEVTYRANDLCYLAPQQQVALVGAPTGTRGCTPVFA